MKTSRFLALLLVLSLFAMPALAESQTENTFVMMGLEEGESARDWSSSLFFSRMQARTGVSFTFREYNDAAAYQTAKNEAFQNNDLPDVFFKASLTPDEELAYLASGQLVDLSPYLEEHAPNLYAILEARPDWRAVVTQPNGAIVTLPILNGADRQCCIWINRTWLDQLGLDMPETIEEYTEVLRAFRDKDPNANGKLDEVPLSLVGPWEAKYFLHAWGLTPNDYNIYVDADGVVRFAPFEAEYQDFVAWLHMALQEGLIDSEAFRTSQSARSTTYTSTDNNAPLTIGGLISTTPYTLINMDKTTDYAVLYPLTHNGTQVYRQLLNGVGRGTFAITSACTDIPAVLQWVDTLYTEEGGRLAFAGVEGEEYTMNANGTWSFNVQGDYARLTEIVNNAIIAGDAFTPGLEPAAFMRNSEIAADNHARKQVDAIRSTLVEPFPVIWPTNPGREARIAELQMLLATHLDTAIANFAMGKTELTDENWQTLMDELKALGAEEFVSLWQETYDEVK